MNIFIAIIWSNCTYVILHSEATTSKVPIRTFTYCTIQSILSLVQKKSWPSTLLFLRWKIDMHVRLHFCLSFIKITQYGKKLLLYEKKWLVCRPFPKTVILFTKRRILLSTAVTTLTHTVIDLTGFRFHLPSTF